MTLPVEKKNRPFFVRMRDAAYHKAYASYRDLALALRRQEKAEKEAIRHIEAFLAALQDAQSYAEDSVRGLKRRHLNMYRDDKDFGVLEEEVVLCHFLEEMRSSSRFLQARLNTDFKLRVYSRRLRRIQTQKPGGEGFITPILASVDKFQETEFIAIGSLLDLMDQRWQVGHGLFEIISRKFQPWLQSQYKE